MAFRMEILFGQFSPLIKSIWEPLSQPSRDSLKSLEKVSDVVCDRLEKGITIEAEAMVKQVVASLKPKPKVEDYSQRLILRSLVGLPYISLSDERPTAINELSGSISWIVRKKINVTEFLREMRDSE